MEKIIKQSSLPLPSLSLSSLSPPNNIHNNIFCDTFSNPKNSIFAVFFDPNHTLPTPFSYLLSLLSRISISCSPYLCFGFFFFFFFLRRRQAFQACFYTWLSVVAYSLSEKQ